MTQEFEYKVVPAPVRGEKAKGVRGRDAKFAHALSQVMNTLGAEGWEYLRADTLPCEERTGITSKTTHYLNMLVFRRAVAQPVQHSPQIGDATAANLIAQAEALLPFLTAVKDDAAPKSGWRGFEDVQDITPLDPESDPEIDGVVDLLAERRSRNSINKNSEKTAQSNSTMAAKTAAE